MTKLLPSNSRFRSILLIFATAVIYFGLASASLRLAVYSSNATAVWPASGFAFAAVLILGRQIAPGVFLGAFAANLLTFLSNDTTDVTTALWASALIGFGNMGEALAGYFILRKLVPGIFSHHYFQKVYRVFHFLYTTIFMCLVSCLIGTLTVHAADVVKGDHFFMVMFTWWTGDVSGILLVTPFLLTWTHGQMETTIKEWKKVLEGVVLMISFMFVTGLVFEAWFTPPFPFSRAIWVTPFLIWAAVRFNQQLVVTIVMISAVLAVWGTVNGHGPFVATSLNESLLTVQGFISINSVMGLVLHAALLEREKTAASLLTARYHLEQLVQERTAALSSSNHQLAEAQRLAHIGSWEWIVKQNRVTWSDELYRIHQQAKMYFEPSYESFLNCVHPDDRKMVEEVVQRCLQEKQAFDILHRIIRPDGVIRVLEARGEVITDDYGAVEKMAGTEQDVTETKLAEELLFKTTRELERKNRELEMSNKELASFSYAASHDLQEPLRKIQLFIDRILQTEQAQLTDAGKDYFRRIQTASIRMKMLIENLLAYSRVTNTVPLFEEADLNLILQEVKSELSEVIQQKGAIIESCSLPRLKVVPFQIRQLFNNVIGNSLKFSKTDSKPHIIIEAEVINGEKFPDPETGSSIHYLHISVCDNGIGFEPVYNEKVFDIFQRLHGQSEYSGTGIGLAICKKIIEYHQGKIIANGEEGKGATFHIYLPHLGVGELTS